MFFKGYLVKGVTRFNINGKLHPRYIEFYEIIEKLNPIAYRLDLPVELKHMHNIFYISQLKKYVPNPNHVIVAKPIEVVENLMYQDMRSKYPYRFEVNSRFFQIGKFRV